MLPLQYLAHLANHERSVKRWGECVPHALRFEMARFSSEYRRFLPSWRAGSNKPASSYRRNVCGGTPTSFETTPIEYFGIHRLWFCSILWQKLARYASQRERHDILHKGGLSWNGRSLVIRVGLQSAPTLESLHPRHISETSWDLSGSRIRSFFVTWFTAKISFTEGRPSSINGPDYNAKRLAL